MGPCLPLSGAVYYLARLRGILGIPIRALFPWPLLAVNLGLSALAGLPAALLILAGLDGVLQLAVSAVLYGLFYPALMLLARRLEPQEIDWGRRLVGTALARPRRWLEHVLPTGLHRVSSAMPLADAPQ